MGTQVGSLKIYPNIKIYHILVYVNKNEII